MGEFLSWSVMKPFRSTSKSVKSAATLPAAVESCQWTNLYRETMGNPAKLQYFLNSILPMWGSVTANHSANLPSSGHLSNMATNVTWWHSRLRLWYPWRGFDHWTHLFELFPPVNVTICINHLRNLRNQNRPFHLVKRHGNKMKIWPEMSDLEIGSRDHWRSGSHPPCLRGGPVTAATPLRLLRTAASASCGSPVCFAHRCLKFGPNKMTLKITIKNEGKWWWTDGCGIHFQTHSISADSSIILYNCIPTCFRNADWKIDVTNAHQLDSWMGHANRVCGRQVLRRESKLCNLM